MSNQIHLPDDSFRDSISTINEDGKRNYVYPKKPSGPYYEKRKILSYILLAALVLSVDLIFLDSLSGHKIFIYL